MRNAELEEAQTGIRLGDAAATERGHASSVGLEGYSPWGHTEFDMTE